MRRGAGCGALVGATLIYVSLCAVLQWANTQDTATYTSTFRCLTVIGVLIALITAGIVIGERK